MKNTFFYKLYSFDRRLFFILATCCFLTLIFNGKGDEVTPFFLWAMYSRKEENLNRYPIYHIRVNDSLLIDYSSGYTADNRFFLSSPLAYYHNIFLNNNIDPGLSFLQKKLGSRYSTIEPIARIVHNGTRERGQFMQWYKRYLQQTTGLQINSIDISVLTGYYNSSNQLQVDAGYLLASWKQH